jgi:1-acyl-sn-glycerol-3-phosphate acyltransferase
MYPHYSYPLYLVWPIVRDWLLGRPRHFQHDARVFTALLGKDLRLSGLENIPADQPIVVTMNHYARRGFGMWWMVFAITGALPRSPHLIMTGELTRWFRPWGGPISRFALPRIARMYGFATMPPMPPRPQDVRARAEAVRRVLRYLQEHQDAILMLAPEGRDNVEDGSLARPPQGVGRFLLQLSSRGLAVLPVGGWEAGGALNIRFGPAYSLDLPLGLGAHERDRVASESSMGHIAALLPQRLRGEYAPTDMPAVGGES